MTAAPCSSCGVPGSVALSGLCAACLLRPPTAAESGALLEPGVCLGPYDIVSRLGHGGMGEVYLGWDTRLCRTVAIKVLAPRFAADPERTRRLEREARIVAGLNHPRICAVYDLGCDSGLTYIVMEHLEGETLAQRLTRGALPLDDALKLAIEIADGLDRAHCYGITHRDLKPANVMLTRSGAKLLDFGLAARTSPVTVDATSGTPAAHMSGFGGTVQYMAPEQRDGRGADVRSDVFSFGLVVREMTAHSSPALDRIIGRCLKPDPEQRWQSLRDVLFELTSLVEEPAALETPHRAAAVRERRPTLAAAVAAAVLVSVGGWVAPAIVRRGVEPPHAIRFAASLPRQNGDVTSGMAFVSPDGRSLAWVSANSEGRTTLAVQALDAAEPTLLSGTEDARWPFWSPDSRTIAFFAQSELRKIQASGGPVETLASAPFGEGGSWSEHGMIVFAPDRTGPLYVIPDRGGEPRPITALDASRQELSHQWPAFLPDGRRFVFFASGGQAEHRGLYMAGLDSPAREWLGPADSGAIWAPPRHLLFTRAGMLVAQPFDVTQRRFTGEPRAVQAHVCGSATVVPPCFSASTTGVLIYHVARLYRHQLAWFTRSGRQLDVPIEPGSYFGPILSADGSRVLLDRHDPQSWQLGLWQFDLGRRVLSRLFDDMTPANGAVWSPDGSALAFSINTQERHEIDTVKAQGGTPQRLFEAQQLVLLTDWAADQRRLLFQTRGGATSDDVWVLPLDRTEPAFAYLHSRFSERQARFSPDGRWVAYTSDQTGMPEVYVQPFPANGSVWQISSDGGHEPTWRRDGSELFYLSRDRRLMAVPLRLTRELGVGPASELFRVPRDAPIETRISYAPAPDGQRFLFNVAAPDRVRLPVFETQVVINWSAVIHE